MPYLPPLQPGQERPQLALEPRKNQEARDQRTRENGRSPSTEAQPIRRRKADALETSGAANPEAGGGRCEGGDCPDCKVYSTAAGGSRGLRSGGRRAHGEGAGRVVSRPAPGRVPAERRYPRLKIPGVGRPPRFSSGACLLLGQSHALTFNPGVRRLAARSSRQDPGPEWPPLVCIESSKPPCADWPSGLCTEGTVGWLG